MNGLKLLIVGVLLVGLVGRSEGADKHELESLRGIESFDVVVECLDTESQEHGITVEKIKTAVELRIKRTGIRVGDKEESYLYVQVTTLWDEAGFFCAAVYVGFNQKVVLKKNKISNFVTTWKTAYLLKGPTKTASSQIFESINDRIDEFLNDYLAANPKD